jgi:hypothetical protein
MNVRFISQASSDITIDIGLITNRMEFIKILNDEQKKFQPCGKKVGSFTR